MGTPADDTGQYPVPERKDMPAAAWSLAPPTFVDVAGLSHVGRVRDKNEDHFLIARFGRALEVLQSNLPEGRVPPRAEEAGFVLFVADGLGGGAAGEVASELAILTSLRLLLQRPDWILRLDRQDMAEEVMRRTAERYEEINAALGEEARRDPNLRGFATTLTAAANLGKDLLVAHAGDSRVYLCRRGQLSRLTRDHTLAQARADAGLLPQERVATHRLRHILLKVIGGQDREVEPDVQMYALEDGDGLLVCTDGLTEMVAEERIAEVLAGGEPAAAVCWTLVEDALAAGGKDNVTVVFARYRFGPAEPPA